MQTETKGILLDVNNWKINISDRSRGRMKLQIKLSKDEAVAYKNFAEVCKPEEISNDDFMKTVFITGIEALNQQLANLVQAYAKENREELASSGITVIDGEDGTVKLADSATLEEEAAAEEIVDSENGSD